MHTLLLLFCCWNFIAFTCTNTLINFILFLISYLDYSLQQPVPIRCHDPCKIVPVSPRQPSLEKLSTTMLSPGGNLSFKRFNSGRSDFVPDIFSVKISLHSYFSKKSNCISNSCCRVLTRAYPYTYELIVYFLQNGQGCDPKQNPICTASAQ